MSLPKPLLPVLRKVMRRYIDENHLGKKWPFDGRVSMGWVVSSANAMPPEHRRFARALLIGMEATWGFEDNHRRRLRYERLAKHAEKVRWHREAFAQAKTKRDQFSQWAIDAAFTEICWGFFIACHPRGAVSYATMEPIGQLVADLLNIDYLHPGADTPEVVAYEAIRQRVRRYRKKVGDDEARRRSIAAFGALLKMLDRYEKPIRSKGTLS